MGEVRPLAGKYYFFKEQWNNISEYFAHIAR